MRLGLSCSSYGITCAVAALLFGFAARADAANLARLRVATTGAVVEPAGQDVVVNSCKSTFTIRDAATATHLPQLAAEFGADAYGVCALNTFRALDVGANVGAFALQVLLAHPEAHVFSVEPLAENRVFYLHNMRVNGIPPERYTLLEGGLSSDGRPFRIAYNANNSFGSQRTDGAGGVGSEGAAIVRTTTLDALLVELGPVEVLKLDCEGCEYEVMFSSRLLLDPAWVGSFKGDAHGCGCSAAGARRRN